MYWIIEALMIVHNILEEYGDDPTTIAGFNGQEDDVTTRYGLLHYDYLIRRTGPFISFQPI